MGAVGDRLRPPDPPGSFGSGSGPAGAAGGLWQTDPADDLTSAFDAAGDRHAGPGLSWGAADPSGPVGGRFFDDVAPAPPPRSPGSGMPGTGGPGLSAPPLPLPPPASGLGGQRSADRPGPARVDSGDYDVSNYLDQELAPALLAAKAEPLGSVGQKKRPPRKSQRPLRGGDSRPDAKADAAQRASRSRSRDKRKPKSPSKLVLGLGLLGVILVGVAAGFLFTQRNGDGDAASTTTAPTTAPPATDVATTTSGDTAEVAAGPEVARPPDVAFNEAAVGPIQSGVPYTLGVVGGPAEPAQYRLLVDGQPQGEPAAELPPATFTPGRHLLVIEITSPQGNISTNPVVVYALDATTPPPSWRANLASVNVQTEGWAEAVRRFDGFVAAGHTNVKLMPSDPYPFLTPGYWNLFVDGFAQRDDALAYCAQFNLEVPGQCFAQRFDAG